jgi:hypothetical protein
MDVLGLSVEELSAVTWACTHVRIPDPAPDYLRQFLTDRLAQDHPALAGKVAALGDWQFHELFLILRSRHSGRA